MISADSYGPTATAQLSSPARAEARDTGGNIQRSRERITLAGQAADSNIGILILVPGADIDSLYLRTTEDLSLHTFTLKRVKRDDTIEDLGTVAGPNNEQVELLLDVEGENDTTQIWISSDTVMPGSGLLLAGIEFTTGQN